MYTKGGLRGKKQMWPSASNGQSKQRGGVYTRMFAQLVRRPSSFLSERVEGKEKTLSSNLRFFLKINCIERVKNLSFSFIYFLYLGTNTPRKSYKVSQRLKVIPNKDEMLVFTVVNTYGILES
jgi:hypothetical protein